MAAPKGEGAAPVAPVVENTPRFVAGDAISGLGNAIESGLKQFTKNQAEEQKNASLKWYADEQSKLNSMLAQGESPSKVNILRQRLNNQAQSMYPQYIEDISKLAKFGEERTGLSTAIDEEKLKREARELGIKDAVTNGGFVVAPGMSERHLDSIYEAHMKSKAIEKQFDSMAKRVKLEIEQNQENRAQAKDFQQKQSIKLLGDLRDTHLSEVQSLIQDAMEDIGKNPDPKNMQKWNATFMTRFSNIDSAITSVGAYSPEVAGMSRHTFDQLREFAKKVTDPAAKRDEVMAEFQRVSYGLQLNTLRNLTPSEQVSFSIGNLFHHPNANLGIAGNVSSMALRLSNEATAKTVPNFIGTKEEPDLYKMLIKSTPIAFDPKSATKEKDIETLATTTNNILRQVETTNTINRGLKPEELKHLATHMASPEFGQLVATGKLDKDAMNNVKKIFQVSYDEHVNRGVLAKLDTTISAGGRYADKPTPMSKFVEISFDGAGISFKPKAIDPEAPLASHLQAQTITKDLESSKAAVNNVIRIGAHLEGTTDYRKYWEDNKHLIMRGYYRKGQEPGKPVPDNPDYIYVGGDARDPDSYMKRIKNGKPS